MGDCQLLAAAAALGASVMVAGANAHAHAPIGKQTAVTGIHLIKHVHFLLFIVTVHSCDIQDVAL